MIHSKLPGGPVSPFGPGGPCAPVPTLTVTVLVGAGADDCDTAAAASPPAPRNPMAPTVANMVLVLKAHPQCVQFFCQFLRFRARIV